MRIPPAIPLSYTDSQLKDAVAASANWRQVMRALGLNETSAGPIRRIKRQAAVLGLDTSHFRGKRSWSDGQLRRAVVQGRCWVEVLAGLGLAVDGSDVRTRIKAHAIRLGLDITHLEAPATESSADVPAADLAHLREAATALAAAWFGLRGCNAAFPVEPATYDLLVAVPEGIKRIQVKDPEMIDLIFIVDGDLNIYLIPSRVIAGRVGILLRTYEKFVVGNATGLMRAGRSRAA
jgi:hypothetical protein